MLLFEIKKKHTNSILQEEKGKNLINKCFTHSSKNTTQNFGKFTIFNSKKEGKNAADMTLDLPWT